MNATLRIKGPGQDSEMSLSELLPRATEEVESEYRSGLEAVEASERSALEYIYRRQFPRPEIITE